MKTLLLTILLLAQVFSLKSQWQWCNPIPQGNTLYSIFASDSVSIFSVGESNAIIKQDLEDDSIFSISTKYNGNLNSVYFTDAQNGYIAGDGGLICKTSDGGKNAPVGGGSGSGLNTRDFVIGAIVFIIIAIILLAVFHHSSKKKS